MKVGFINIDGFNENMKGDIEEWIEKKRRTLKNLKTLVTHRWI